MFEVFIWKDGSISVLRDKKPYNKINDLHSEDGQFRKVVIQE